MVVRDRFPPLYAMRQAVDLTDLFELKQLISRLDFVPRKNSGQNFLVDAGVRDFMLDAAELQADDQVIEVGPGLGVMTEGLLTRVSRVISIELDKALHEHLQLHFAEAAGLELIQGDALEVDLKGLVRSGADIMVSNLPYSAGSRILYELAGPVDAPRKMVVMLQTDVGERITAVPGTKRYGILGIWLQTFYETRILREVGASSFHPRPRVGSAIVELTWRTTPRVEVADWALYQRLIKVCFSQRRKQLGTILRKAPSSVRCTQDDLIAVGLDPTIRPECLTVEEWGALANFLTAS
ncbi:MAG: 16S rRNA (adenine1518-N6/adenine1519-N6)-dimethyltransferase [Candidatus Omnitrophota bacterium]|jgi:16S rRNA (adenine1518-N6/adenine1519-N6)-dimethyltransferase